MSEAAVPPRPSRCSAGGGFAKLTFIAAVLVACSDAPGPDSLSHNDSGAAQSSFQARCEQAPSTGPVQAASPLSWPTAIKSIPLLIHPVWLVSALEVDGALMVLDGDQGSLLTLDSAGRVVMRIGQSGSGPGDLTFPPVYIGSQERFIVTDSGRTFIADGNQLQAFRSDGSFEAEGPIGVAGSGELTDVHVAALNDSVQLVSYSKQWQVRLPMAERAQTTIARIVSRDDGKIELEPIGTASNHLVRYDSVPGRAPQAPYRNLFRRTWGAGNNSLVIVGYEGFRLCRISLPSGALTAVDLNVEPRPVDEAEQEREMRRLFGETDIKMPGMDQTAREYLEGTWPSHAPFYHDVMVAPDGNVLASRLAPEGASAADLYGPDNQYLATYIVPKGIRRVRLLSNATLLAYDFESGDLGYYALNNSP